MSAVSRQYLQQVVGTSIVTFVCIAAIALLQVPQLNALQQEANAPSIERVRQEIASQKIQLNLLEKMPTFGFDNVIADWAFLNFLQYFGDKPARERTDYTLSPEFFDVVMKRNPYFLFAYNFLSTSTALYAGMPERSIALMNQGLQSLTPTTPAGSFFVWRNKGIDELLFLGDSNAARQSFEQAAEWAIQSRLPGSEQVAAVSTQTARFLATNPDSKTAQVAAWVMVLESAPDDRTRRTAINRIRALGGNFRVNPDGTIDVGAPAED